MLYMNPAPNVLPRMDGYFRTRKLDACKHGIVIYQREFKLPTDSADIGLRKE